MDLIEFNGHVQFRGGATMHGPKPRSHAFKLNKKVHRLGLKIALTARAAEGKACLLSLSSISFFWLTLIRVVVWNLILKTSTNGNLFWPVEKV